jgi:hypothetical protein
LAAVERVETDGEGEREKAPILDDVRRMRRQME